MVRICLSSTESALTYEDGLENLTLLSLSLLWPHRHRCEVSACQRALCGTSQSSSRCVLMNYCWYFTFSYLQNLLSGMSKQRFFLPILFSHTLRNGNANIYKRHRTFMLLPPWFSSCVRSLAINKSGCVSCYCYSTRGQELCVCVLAHSQIYRTVIGSLFSLAAYTSDYRWQSPTVLGSAFLYYTKSDL